MFLDHLLPPGADFKKKRPESPSNKIEGQGEPGGRRRQKKEGFGKRKTDPDTP